MGGGEKRVAKEKESEGGGRKMERCGRKVGGGEMGDGLFANERVHRADSEVNEERQILIVLGFSCLFVFSETLKLRNEKLC